MKNDTNTELHFPTEFTAILDRIANVDPVGYGKSRNYIDGAVSYLSPYISRGVISTKFVYQQLLKRNFHPNTILKFIQELAWRDYWQQVWMAKGNALNDDLKQIQIPVATNGISENLVNATTGIKVIDDSIKEFYKTGYLHNHVRMYIAAIACNIGQNHWKHPAKWMYYHLLDADWASNALSWQWVAGANSNKKYYANQENINHFCHSNQKGTFLDISYEDFENLEIPNVLLASEKLALKTPLPKPKPIIINKNLPTLIYNFYNLDPNWKKDFTANRVLLLEPSHFKEYPIAQNTLHFIMGLSNNIESIQIFVGEFKELTDTYSIENCYYKEHPLNQHYQGIEEQRDWMFSVKGYYPSFFAFWKKCKKEIIF